jgi:uncharacterized protein (DUF488 family)
MKIFTIGYGGRKQDEFINLLKLHDIQVVIDVRLRPDRASLGIYAKSKDPNKGIQGLLERAGIQYLSFVELGNVFVDLENWGPLYQKLLDNAGEILCQRLYQIDKTFCLMCCEKNASKCHRKLIAEYLINRGYEVEHLE